MGGKQSKGTVTEQDKAILDLKIQRDRLQQYQKRITLLISQSTQAAKAELAPGGDKKRALLALRKRKYQESLLLKTDGQLMELEKLAANVEMAQIQRDVVNGIQQGTKVLMDIHAEMGGIERVEKLMGESADQVAYTKEVSDLLGSKISDQDEADVEDELAALEAEMAGDKTTELPNVPNAELPMPQKVPDVEPEREERQAIAA